MRRASFIPRIVRGFDERRDRFFSPLGGIRFKGRGEDTPGNNLLFLSEEDRSLGSRNRLCISRLAGSQWQGFEAPGDARPLAGRPTQRGEWAGGPDPL